MSKFSQELRLHRIFNNWDLLKRFGGPGDVVIDYTRPPEGRLGWCKVVHSTVWSLHPHPKLAVSPPDKHGKKEFIGNRADSFPKALAWAKETFGHEYVPSPHGGYLPKHIIDKARELVKKSKVKL